MQIEVWHYDNRYTMTLNEELSADDLLEHWYRMMVLLGYHPESVDSAVLLKAEEIETKE